MDAQFPTQQQMPVSSMNVQYQKPPNLIPVSVNGLLYVQYSNFMGTKTKIDLRRYYLTRDNRSEGINDKMDKNDDFQSGAHN